MSDAKFTKGKWRVQVVETNRGRNILEVVTNTFYVYCQGLGVRNKHDAHLIAAAPEMYEEIKREVSSLECKLIDARNSGEVELIQSEIDRKVNLLAKARGEQWIGNL